jgi:hypothetical protein
MWTETGLSNKYSCESVPSRHKEIYLTTQRRLGKSSSRNERQIGGRKKKMMKPFITEVKK